MNCSLTASVLAGTQLDRANSILEITLGSLHYRFPNNIILRTTSPIPIGRTPGHLSRGIRRQPLYNYNMPSGRMDPRRWYIQILRAHAARAEQRSLDFMPKAVQNRLQSIAPAPDGLASFPGLRGGKGGLVRTVRACAYLFHVREQWACTQNVIIRAFETRKVYTL